MFIIPDGLRCAFYPVELVQLDELDTCLTLSLTRHSSYHILYDMQSSNQHQNAIQSGYSLTFSEHTHFHVGQNILLTCNTVQDLRSEWTVGAVQLALGQVLFIDCTICS